MKEKSKSLPWLTVFAISIVLCLAGCATKQVEVVHSSLAPFPEALDSAIIIATNDPIQITVGEAVAKKDLGGYVAAHPSDMEALVKEIDKLRRELDGVDTEQ